MNFIIFNGALLLAGIIAISTFSIGLMLLLAPLALFTRSGKRSKAIVLPFVGIVGIFQIYFWGIWAAFCVALTIRFTQKPDVTWDLLYWLAGFGWCISLICWLVHKEMQSSQSPEEAQGIQKGTILYSLIAIVAFLFFAFAPSYILPPYGFLMKPLGLESHIVLRNTNRSEIDATVSKTIEAFFDGYDYFVSAGKLARGMASSKDHLGDIEKARTLMDKSKDRLSECDIELLNKLYDGWGNIVSNKFIPAIDLLLSGIQPEGNRNDLARGDALMAELDEYVRNNWSKILVTLNEKYGYEIR